MKNKTPVDSKLFWITFLSAAIALTILFGIFYQITLQQEVETGKPLIGVTVPEYTASDNVNFLIIYDADLSGEDLFAATVCCNTATKIISVCEMDLRTDSLVDLSHTSLNKQYQLRGLHSLQLGIENLLQSDFNNFIRCDRKGLFAMVNQMGGVRVPSESGMSERFYNAFSFCQTFDQQTDRADLFYALVTACFADNESLEQSQKIIFARCDTDLTAYTALQHQKALQYLIEKQQFSKLQLPVHQAQIGSSFRYLPDPDSLTILQNAMR